MAFEKLILDENEDDGISNLPVEYSKTYEFTGVPVFERYYSDDSSWGVYNFYSDIDLPKSKRKTNGDLFFTDEKDIKSVYLITLRGKMQRLETGELPYKVKAKISNHSKFGWGYEVVSISQDKPVTLEDQKSFLSAILTENQVESLFTAYPNIIDMTIKGEEIDLNKTKGIKEYTWKIIKDKILDNYLMAEELAMLSKFGISYKKIKQLFREEENPQLLKQKLFEDPYIITKVHGIGFKTADDIALKINPSLLVSEQRAKAFIKNYLEEIGDSKGDTWIFLSELDSAIKDNLIEVEDVYKEVINKEIENKTFLYLEKFGETYKVGLDHYRWMEEEIWNKIRQLNDSDPIQISQEDIEKGIVDSEQEQGFKFTDEQRDAIINMTKNNFSLLSSPAGCGKSTISRGILKIYDRAGYSINCSTLSAKAATRLNETTGYDGKTIHRLLESKGLSEFTYNKYFPLPQGVYLIDESSMINAYIFFKLLDAIPIGSKVILVGDSFQISPIGYGNIFFDLLNKNNLQSNKLTKILRQAEKSGIISDSNMIRQGISPFNKKELKMTRGELQDITYIFRDSRESLNTIAINAFMKSLESGKTIDDVIILVPRRNNVVNSTEEINNKIQSLLFTEEDEHAVYGKRKYYKGDKIIHIKNDYDKGVMNGEMGYVKSIERDDKNKDYIVVSFTDKDVEYTRSELKDIDLGYSLTTFKFQGSQCSDVIVVIDNTHYILLSKNYLYTSITRAVNRCLVLSEPYAFDYSVKTDKNYNKNTWLQGFI